MRKKENHTNEPFKLTVFRSFEEMKASPFSFPSSDTPKKRLAELKKAYSKLRATYVEGNVPPTKSTNKKTSK
jgi:hypothetical protein